eukprot:GDKJ01016749.1.p1 GENE.GDKJ01016749.1~~GDKJ01016749.1.p1  ORF type:complete len:379 (+),score=113.31 GDKJ01016749.1:22-1137(+)
MKTQAVNMTYYRASSNNNNNLHFHNHNNYNNNNHNHNRLNKMKLNRRTFDVLMMSDRSRRPRSWASFLTPRIVAYSRKFPIEERLAIKRWLAQLQMTKRSAKYRKGNSHLIKTFINSVLEKEQTADVQKLPSTTSSSSLSNAKLPPPLSVNTNINYTISNNSMKSSPPLLPPRPSSTSSSFNNSINNHDSSRTHYQLNTSSVNNNKATDHAAQETTRFPFSKAANQKYISSQTAEDMTQSNKTNTQHRNDKKKRKNPHTTSDQNSKKLTSSQLLKKPQNNNNNNPKRPLSHQTISSNTPEGDATFPCGRHPQPDLPPPPEDYIFVFSKPQNLDFKRPLCPIDLSPGAIPSETSPAVRMFLASQGIHVPEIY